MDNEELLNHELAFVVEHSFQISGCGLVVTSSQGCRVIKPPEFAILKRPDGQIEISKEEFENIWAKRSGKQDLPQT